MKKKELEDLKGKEIRDIEKLLKERRLGFAKAMVDLKVSREKNLKKAKSLRRDIAQILTILREKEILELNAKDKEHSGKQN